MTNWLLGAAWAIVFIIVLVGALLIASDADDPCAGEPTTMNLSGIEVPAGLDWEFSSHYLLQTTDVGVDTMWVINGYGERP